MLDHLFIMKEFALILRGDHPKWEGDRIRNSDYYLWKILNDMPDEADLLAKDIAANINDFSEQIGVHLDTLGHAISMLTKRY